MDRFAFLVEVPGKDNRQEYACADEDLTAAEAVQRCYDTLPDGAEIVKPLRGNIPADLEVDSEQWVDSEPFDPVEEDFKSGTEEQPHTQDEIEQEDNDFEWSESDWLDEHWKTRQSTVEAGDVDDRLEEIAECETSDTVIDAVEERLGAIDD